jgi:hypothetical protein
MAKSTETQWIPSGGVLAVAIVAALAAVILVNLYISYARSAYETGSTWYFQVKRPVNANDPIQEANLEAVQIPKVLEGSFKQAVPATDNGRSMVVSKKVRRKLLEGEFLWKSDFDVVVGAAASSLVPPKDFVVITIPINTKALPGELLQPGTYVTFLGTYNYGTDRDPDYRTIPVMECVQVKALGGSTEIAVKGRNYDNVQIIVPKKQEVLISDAVRVARDSRWSIDLSPLPEPNAKPPDINQEVLNYVDAKRARVTRPATTSTVPTKGGTGGVIVPPPDDFDLP